MMPASAQVTRTAYVKHASSVQTGSTYHLPCLTRKQQAQQGHHAQPEWQAHATTLVANQMQSLLLFAE